MFVGRLRTGVQPLERGGNQTEAEKVLGETNTPDAG